MTGGDNYAECELLIEQAFDSIGDGHPFYLAAAQVRGLLAVADAIDDLRKALKS